MSPWSASDPGEPESPPATTSPGARSEVATATVLDPPAPSGLHRARPSRPRPVRTSPIRFRVRPRGTAEPRDPEEVGPPASDLAEVATEGVRYLTYWLVILILTGQAVVSFLRPPAGNALAGLAAGAVCILWALFCLGMGILRNRGPDGRDVPPPGWLPVVSSAGAVVSLGLLSRTFPGTELWPSQFIASALLVGSSTTWLGAFVGGVIGASLVTLSIVRALGMPPNPANIDPSLLPGITTIAFAFAAAAAVRGLARSALELQRVLDDRDELLVREGAIASASALAAELERSLHDTALNTLETISAHGDHLDPEAVASRCRADYVQLALWRSEQLTNLGQVVSRLTEHAERLGLELNVEALGELPQWIFPGSPRDRPPRAPLALSPAVLRALCGSATEALTNVRKHAQVEGATLLVHHDSLGVHLVVVDGGVGVPEDEAGGFGLVNSVKGRIESAGGTADVRPNPAGAGTVVVLGWEPVVAESAHASNVSDQVPLLERAALIATGIGGVLALIEIVLLALIGRPPGQFVLLSVSAVLPTFTGAWAIARVRDGHRVGWVVIAVGCSAYAAAVLLAPLANPDCNPLLGEAVLLAARAPMMATLLLLAPRLSVLMVLMTCVVVSHTVVGVMWSRSGAPCGPELGSAWVYVVAVLAATWLFVLRIGDQSNALIRAREEAVAAQLRIGTNLALRSEEEGWVADTLASAQAVLRDIGSGMLPPGDPATRGLCRAEASHLRALLIVGQASDTFRRPARIWLQLLRAHGFSVQVRGAFAGLEPPTRIIGEAGATINLICARFSGGSLTMGAWPADDGADLMLTVSGRRWLATRDRLTIRLIGLAPSALFDRSDEDLTASWHWRSTLS